MESVEELYAKAVAVVPEPGMHEGAVRAMLQEAVDFSEGVTMFFVQGTMELVRELLSIRHKYHETINDFDVLERLRDTLCRRES